MASPLDPWISAFESDPLTGMVLLVVGALLLVGPEILVATLYLRPMLAKKLRKDIRTQLLADVDAGLLDPAIKRATDGVREDVAGVKSLIEGDELQSQVVMVQDKLEALDAALGQHLTNLQDGLRDLPARVRSSLEGKRGAEMKEIYKEANAAETKMVEYYEAEMSPEERLALRVQQIEPSPEYQEKHPGGTMLLRGFRDYISESIGSHRGTVTMRKTKGKGGFPDVYQR